LAAGLLYFSKSCIDMFKNYFKIAWRNLLKDKLHSFINIIGLSLGMSVAILIGIWMYNEFSYDKIFKNYKNIAQVMQNLSNNGEMQTWQSVPYPLADELRANYGSDFKHIVMAVNWGDHTLTIDDKKFKLRGGFFEKEMPEMFTLAMLKGSRAALNDQSLEAISDGTNVTIIFKNIPSGIRPEDNEMGAALSLEKLTEYVDGSS
jgi:putative ABC transport system permease protein